MAKYVQLAIEEAKKSQLTFKHGAVFVKGGKIIATGHNSSRSKRGREIETCTHAEIDVLSKVKDAKKGKLIIVRIPNSKEELEKGNLLYSAPCMNCLQEIRKREVKEIIFSDGIGLTCFKARYFQTNHLSFAQKERKCLKIEL